MIKQVRSFLGSNYKLQWQRKVKDAAKIIV